MDDLDKTIPPRRVMESGGADDRTMPGKRIRKAAPLLAVGDLIMGRYKILAELGQGCMGPVFRCLDETAGIEVALKALPPELSSNASIMEEIKENFQSAARLVHQNAAILKQLEKDDSGNACYLIMECCEGEVLRRWSKRSRKDGQLSFDAALSIVKQVAAVLDYAHEQHMLHRDINPGNIIVNNAGKVKILNFGLSAQLRASATHISMAYHCASGADPYMAPEQWRGRAYTPRSDQYALAVVTYEMLAGYLPFESTDISILKEAVLNDTPEEIPDIPKAAQAALKRAMSKDPAARFENCSDFAAALGGSRVGSAPKQKKTIFPPWAAGLIIAVLLLGAGGTGYFFFNKQQKEKKRLEALARSRQEQLKKENTEKERADKKKEAEEKAQQERIRKERAAREKEEKLKRQTLEENYRLHPLVAKKKLSIEVANHDRGQQFGKYLDILKNNFESAKLAWREKDHVSANKFLKEADRTAEWILKNAPLRQEVRSLQKQAEEARSGADRIDGSSLSQEAFQKAQNSLDAANKSYEAGNFTAARKDLKSAIAGFGKAYTDARRLITENLLNAARIAQNSKQWNKLRELAEKLRPYDSRKADEFIRLANTQLRPEKAAAPRSLPVQKVKRKAPAVPRLKQKAEKKVIPTLTITAYADGQKVNAKIRALKEEPDRKSTPWKLRKGSTYEFEVTYNSSKGDYIGKIPVFVCSADTPFQKKVLLTKIRADKLIDCNGVMLEMNKIPKGSFVRSDGRTVQLTKDFWLGKFEVTQEQYKAVMGRNPSKFQGSSRPVEQVTWYDARSFCRKLNKIYAGKLPEGYRFDLPTESQWEYACRAGTTTDFSCGDASDTAKMNFDGNTPWGGGSKGVYRRKTVDVGSLGYRNGFGLADMHGNVLEWCRDWYGSYHINKIDPVGPTTGECKVTRGGSWFHGARFCRSVNRNYGTPEASHSTIGFRLALVPYR